MIALPTANLEERDVIVRGDITKTKTTVRVVDRSIASNLDEIKIVLRKKEKTEYTLIQQESHSRSSSKVFGKCLN